MGKNGITRMEIITGIKVDAKDLVTVLDVLRNSLREGKTLKDASERVEDVLDKVFELHKGGLALRRCALDEQKFLEEKLVSPSPGLPQSLLQKLPVDIKERVVGIQKDICRVLLYGGEGRLKKGLWMKLDVILNTQLAQTLSIFADMPDGNKEKGLLDEVLTSIEDAIKEGEGSILKYNAEKFQEQVNKVKGILAPKKTLVLGRKKCKKMLVYKQSLKRMGFSEAFLNLHPGGKRPLHEMMEILIKTDNSEWIALFICRNMDWAVCAVDYGIESVEIFERALVVARSKKKKAIAVYLSEQIDRLKK